MTIVLATARLQLRTVGVDDAAFYLGLVNEPSFIANIGDRGIRTLEAAREAVSSGPMLMYATRGHSLYVVERKDDGAAIGMCGLIKRETLDDVDLGYAYLPEFAGQGYASEAAAGVLAHARSLGLKRVVAITSPGNAASDAVLRRVGMRFEKMVKLTAEDTGTQLFAIELS